MPSSNRTRPIAPAISIAADASAPATASAIAIATSSPTIAPRQKCKHISAILPGLFHVTVQLHDDQEQRRRQHQERHAHDQTREATERSIRDSHWTRTES